jgi:tetratricopeptide (TPR) repeat protein
MKRAALIAAVFGVLVLIAGGIAFYVRQSRTDRLLVRCRVALQAGQFARSADLAQQYISRRADDWNGYHALAQSLIRLGRHADAQPAIIKAMELHPDKVSLPIMLADTWIVPAERMLDPINQPTIASIEKAVSQLDEGHRILLDIEPAQNIDMVYALRAIGANEHRLFRAWRFLADAYAHEAETAAAAGAEQQKLESEQMQTQADSKADEMQTRSFLTLVECVNLAREIPELRQGKHHEELLENVNSAMRLLAAMAARDEERAAVLQKAMDGLEDVTPAAAATAAMNAVALSRIKNPSQTPQARQRAAELMDRLLKTLPSDHPDLADIKLPRSELAMTMGDLVLAEKLVAEVLKTEASNRNAQLLEGSLLLRRGQVMEAERKLFLVKTQNPEWAEAQYIYAHAASEAGKPALARDAMQAVVNLYPGHVQARGYLVDLYIRDGLLDNAFDEAASLYRYLRAPDPQALLLYVRAAKSSGRANLARRELENAARQVDKHPAMAIAVAEGYAMLGDGNAVVEAAQNAFKHAGDNPDAQLAAARALLMAGKLQEAELALAIQVAKHPKHSELAFELGRLYHATGRRMAAIEQYRAAAAVDPANLDVRLALAKAHFENGDLEHSKSLLDSFDDTNTEANVLRLQIRILQGQPVGAEQAAQAAAAASSSAMDVALAFFVNGEIDKCIEVCRKEVDQTGGNSQLRALLGQAYSASGQLDLCVEQLIAIIQSDPEKLSGYLTLAGVLSTNSTIDQIRQKMEQAPAADPRMIDLAIAWLLMRNGEFQQAAEIYRRVDAKMANSPDDRNRARLLLAYCLAREGKQNLAMAELDLLAANQQWAPRALEAKAQLLASMDMLPEAVAAAQKLHELAKARSSAEYLERAAFLYFRLNHMNMALQACEELLQIMPNDDRPYIVQADILTAAGRRDEAITLYQTAIAIRPMRFSNHLSLARLYEAQLLPKDALSALDKLKEMSPLARGVALFERAAMFARWGLYEKAIEDLEEVSETDRSRGAEVTLRLAQCHALLGQLEQAFEQADCISPHAPQYIAAQQLKASFQQVQNDRIAILQAAMNHPSAGPEALGQTMAALIRQGRHADAVRQFVDFEKRHGHIMQIPGAVTLQAIEARSACGEIPAAVDLAKAAHQKTNVWQWRALQVLMHLAHDSGSAGTLMVEPGRSNTADTLLGLCYGALTDQHQLSADYYQKFKRIEQALGQTTDASPEGLIGIERLQIGNPPAGATIIKRPFEWQSTYKILSALCAGDHDSAANELKTFKGAVGVPIEAAVDLVNAAGRNAQVAKEAARILMATMAIELEAPVLARLWMSELLERNPANLWAAATLIRAEESEHTCNLVLKAVDGRSVVLTTLVRASLHKLAGRANEAADLYRDAAQAEPSNAALVLSHALSAETADRPQEALEAYLQVHQTVSHPVAANNAAYLITLLYPRDEVQLNQARILADAAISAAPGISLFHDTRGWIAYLLNDNETARRELRIALRGAPHSPEVHYHIALAELAGGDRQLSQWHLAAAAALGEGLAKIQPTPSAGALLAAQKARQALDGQSQ